MRRIGSVFDSYVGRCGILTISGERSRQRWTATRAVLQHANPLAIVLAVEMADLARRR